MNLVVVSVGCDLNRTKENTANVCAQDTRLALSSLQIMFNFKNEQS